MIEKLAIFVINAIGLTIFIGSVGLVALALIKYVFG